jgi:hypothetical protein
VEVLEEACEEHAKSLPPCVRDNEGPLEQQPKVQVWDLKHKTCAELDCENGNSKWQEATPVELDLLDEFKAVFKPLF